PDHSGGANATAVGDCANDSKGFNGRDGASGSKDSAGSDDYRGQDDSGGSRVTGEERSQRLAIGPQALVGELRQRRLSETAYLGQRRAAVVVVDQPGKQLAGLVGPLKAGNGGESVTSVVVGFELAQGQARAVVQFDDL